MIKIFGTLLFVFTFCINGISQNYNGVWQGLMTFQTEDYAKSNILFMDIKITGDEIEGFVRIESVAYNYFAYKSVYGRIKDGVLIFHDSQILKFKNEFKSEWCLNQYELKYDKETAYIKGTFKSDECNFDYGHIILFRSKEKIISKTDSSMINKSWRKKFLSDLKRGKSAPEILDKEMKNFIFKPVLFGHNSDTVATEYFTYLNELSDIVMSHSDLRIKIIGHTDAVGPNEYNTGLSKRRAESIKTHLISQGLDEKRIVIEFKGETQPIGTNNTDEGKKQNRRVDVIFI